MDEDDESYEKRAAAKRRRAAQKQRQKEEEQERMKMLEAEAGNLSANAAASGALTYDFFFCCTYFMPSGILRRTKMLCKVAYSNSMGLSMQSFKIR